MLPEALSFSLKTALGLIHPSSPENLLVVHLCKHQHWSEQWQGAHTSQEPFPREFWLPCLDTKQETCITSLWDGTLPNTSKRSSLGHPCAASQQNLASLVFLLALFSWLF